MTSTTGSTARRAWDSTPRRRRVPAGLLVLAALVLIPSVMATVLRLIPPRDDGTAMLASFIPYAIFGYAMALVLLVVALIRAPRRWPIGLAGVGVAALLTCHLVWIAPFYVPDGRAGGAHSFTIYSQNLYKGSADPDQVRQAAEGADIVVLLETTPKALSDLRTRGWDEQFPYAVGELTDWRSDSAVFSRFPLTGSQLIGPTSFQEWLTTAEIPGIGPVHVAGVHPCNPYCGQNKWSAEHAALRSTLRPLVTTATVAAGDFNAVDDHGPLQALRSDGWASGSDLTGAGWMPTWPVGRAYPPLLALDHVLVSPRLTVTAIRSVRISGTDHLGLLATIAPTA